MFNPGDKVLIEGEDGVYTVKGMFGPKAVAIHFNESGSGHKVRPLTKVTLARETKLNEI